MSRLQRGFRNGHSCERQLHRTWTVNDLTSYRDRKVQVDVVILDFSKAFNVVPHKSPMRKLTHYGIGGMSITGSGPF